MTTQEQAISEATARRLARKYGYVLRKSHSRTPDAPDYGLYNLFDPSTGWAILAQNDAVLSPFNWTLEYVVDYLNDPRVDHLK